MRVLLILLLACARAARAGDDIQPEYVQTCDATHCWREGGGSGGGRPYVPKSERGPYHTPQSLAYEHYTKGRGYASAGDWTAAEAEARAALQSDSDSRNGGYYYYDLGYALLRQDRHSEALDALRQSAARVPDYHSVHNNMGWLLLRLGREAEAEASYLAALRLRPADAGTQAYLLQLVSARARALTGPAFRSARDASDPREEERLLRELLLVEPSHEAQNNLGYALERQERWLEADAAYREAQRLDPADEMYRRNRAELHRDPRFVSSLMLANGTKFWSELAAGAKGEAMKYMALKCFDDGCAYSEDRSLAVRLLSPPRPQPPPREPPAVRDDPDLAALRFEASVRREKYERAYEGLRALWKVRKKDKDADATGLALVERAHAQELAAQDEGLREAEKKVEKRYADLGFAPPAREP